MVPIIPGTFQARGREGMPDHRTAIATPQCTPPSPVFLAQFLRVTSGIHTSTDRSLHHSCGKPECRASTVVAAVWGRAGLCVALGSPRDSVYETGNNLGFCFSPSLFIINQLSSSAC
jgi:hypothetical protein